MFMLFRFVSLWEACSVLNAHSVWIWLNLRGRLRPKQQLLRWDGVQETTFSQYCVPDTERVLNNTCMCLWFEEKGCPLCTTHSSFALLQWNIYLSCWNKQEVSFFQCFKDFLFLLFVCFLSSLNPVPASSSCVMTSTLLGTPAATPCTPRRLGLRPSESSTNLRQDHKHTRNNSANI